MNTNCNCKEYWISIKNGGKNNNGKYQISSKGNLISICRNGKIKLLKKTSLNNNYQKNAFGLIHRTVGKYFINNGKDFKGLDIDHIDTNKTNNCVCNLRICTHKENSNNPLTLNKFKGKNNPMFGKKHTEESKNKMRKKKTRVKTIIEEI
jgi:hypothetical protein